MPTETYDAKTDMLGFAAFGALLIVACVAWYFAYVQPREEFLLAVADCTEDNSRTEWDRCVGEVSR